MQLANPREFDDGLVSKVIMRYISGFKELQTGVSAEMSKEESCYRSEQDREQQLEKPYM